MTSDRKIAFFDIDGTLTSELDGSVPASAKEAIRKARDNGHLMFLNTGRCFQNVEPRFREVGFDGFVCGCGTHILIDPMHVHSSDSFFEMMRPSYSVTDGYHSLFHTHPSPEVIAAIRDKAKEVDVDILFESSTMVVFDQTRPLHHPAARRQLDHFLARNYDMTTDLYAPDFYSDKFVFWYQSREQLNAFRTFSDAYFDFIDRHEGFAEFVPKGYSKATGIQYLLDYFHVPLENAYAFGDSANDMTMLSYVPGSVAMGNTLPESIKETVSFVTKKASEDGIAHALKELNFL